MGIGNYFKCEAVIISALMTIVVAVTVLSRALSKTEIGQSATVSLSVPQEDFVNKLHALENCDLKTIAIESLGNDTINISYRNDNTLIERDKATKENLMFFVLIVSTLAFALYGIGTIIDYII